jgi:excisionase family DNA binding protein
MVDEAVKRIVEQTLREIVPDLLRQVLREHYESAAIEPSDDGYLTTAEAADCARVNPATIRQWISKGHLTRHRAGRELRVSKSELRAFLKCQASEAQSLDTDEIADEIVKSL